MRHDPPSPWSHDDKGWLARRIREAQEEVASWPEWMRQSAKFEGSYYAPKEEDETDGRR